MIFRFTLITVGSHITRLSLQSFVTLLCQYSYHRCTPLSDLMADYRLPRSCWLNSSNRFSLTHSISSQINVEHLIDWISSQALPSHAIASTSLACTLIAQFSHLNMSSNICMLRFPPCTESTSKPISDHHGTSCPIRSYVLDWWLTTHQSASPCYFPCDSCLLYFVICSMIYGLLSDQSHAWCGLLTLFDLQDQSMLDLCCFLYLKPQSSAIIPQSSQSPFNVGPVTHDHTNTSHQLVHACHFTSMWPLCWHPPLLSLLHWSRQDHWPTT